jgi:hypothetical protein
MASVLGGKNSKEIAGRFCPRGSAGVRLCRSSRFSTPNFDGFARDKSDCRYAPGCAFIRPFGPDFVTVSPFRPK